MAFIQDRKQQKGKQEGENENKEDESDNEFFLISENGNICNEVNTNNENNKDNKQSLITVESINNTENDDKIKEDIEKNEGIIENNKVDEDIKPANDIPKGAVYKTFFKKKTILNEDHFANNQIQNNPITETFINNINKKKGIRFKRRSALEFQLDNIKYKLKILFFTS